MTIVQLNLWDRPEYKRKKEVLIAYILNKFKISEKFTIIIPIS